MSTTPPFPFPREYAFPPFFTRQTNLTTHHAQLTKWAALVLAYCRHHRLFKLSLSSAISDPLSSTTTTDPLSTPDTATATDLFHNRALNRRLSLADAREVLDFLRRDGRAEPVDGSGGGDVVWVYWRTPEEWAGLVEGWVDETAQRGGVLTLYELREGDATRGAGMYLPSPGKRDGLTAWPRVSRHGRGLAAKGAGGVGQEGQGADLWAGGLVGCQVLLRDCLESTGVCVCMRDVGWDGPIYKVPSTKYMRWQHGYPHAQERGAAKISSWVIENKTKNKRPKLLAAIAFPSPQPPSVDRYYKIDARLAKETRVEVR